MFKVQKLKKLFTGLKNWTEIDLTEPNVLHDAGTFEGSDFWTFVRFWSIH